jgi:hypothetical protein
MKIMLMLFCCQLTLKPVYITNITLKVNFHGMFWNSHFTLLVGARSAPTTLL